MSKRPGKIQSFFNTDSVSTDPPRQGSLSELITRQLEQKQAEQPEERSSGTPSGYPGIIAGGQQAFLLYQQAYRRIEHSRQQGNYLNEVDGQTGNGLEHLLPNAGTRFGIAYRRLEQEISDIKAKIRDYELILSQAPASQKTNLKENIQLLKSRLLVLERRFYKVSLSLAQAEEQTHPIRSAFKRPWLQLELWTKENIRHLLRQAGISATASELFKSAKSREKEKQYSELLQAQALLETETRKPAPNPQTISTLVFRYEQALQSYQAFLSPRKNN